MNVQFGCHGHATTGARRDDRRKGNRRSRNLRIFRPIIFTMAMAGAFASGSLTACQRVDPPSPETREASSESVVVAANEASGDAVVPPVVRPVEHESAEVRSVFAQWAMEGSGPVFCRDIFDSDDTVKRQLQFETRRADFCTNSDVYLRPDYLGYLGGFVFEAQHHGVLAPAFAHGIVGYPVGEQFFTLSCELDPEARADVMRLRSFTHAQMDCEPPTTLQVPVMWEDKASAAAPLTWENLTVSAQGFLMGQGAQADVLVNGVRLRWSDGRDFSQRCSDFPSLVWLPNQPGHTVWYADQDAWTLARVHVESFESWPAEQLAVTVSRCAVPTIPGPEAGGHGG